MATAVQDGTCYDAVVWKCDCPQCELSTDQLAHNMSFEYVSKNLPAYQQAAHAMIYAADDRVLFGSYRMISNIMVSLIL